MASRIFELLCERLRRAWAACSLRVRGTLARAFAAASASLRAGVARPSPPHPSDAGGTGVVSGLQRRNTDGLLGVLARAEGLSGRILTGPAPLAAVGDGA